MQGVYELYEKERSTEWEGEQRLSRLVFIGKPYVQTWSIPKPVVFHFGARLCTTLSMSFLVCVPVAVGGKNSEARGEKCLFFGTFN